MSSSSAIEPRPGSYNPAKSWKALLLLVPIIGGWALVSYKSQLMPGRHAEPVRATSAADGKVVPAEPRFGIDSPVWDGRVTWHPYPNAASYEVALFSEP